ncbi:Uncharacterised protein [Salmonella enterica subsp. salamae]|uniref:Uncharacterized protein n=1 Tax=Salmonella enterica TaxID=28901 RepID=A0A379Q4H5_SALER|nr:Uncharacterised protein [Salmonella enterica subsp. salamae]SQI67925.1 Uncharacterised protein [Salmonella enterica subsp. salamae]SUF36507.1 Uncharacterised protein [Salmonella enterica]SUF68907.1 Uncharacterised protein [Salmonella enterica]SUI19070.1 Uncharacterised protein [Salmonella enterica subsp. salamae]
MISPHDNVNSSRVTDYPDRSYLVSRSLIHIVHQKGRLSWAYKIFFISVKTLINENSLFFDLNHFLVFAGK